MNINSKIVLVVSEFPPLPGGIGNHALHFALSLHKNGKKVTVITDQRSSEIQDDTAYDAQLPFAVLRIKRKKFTLFTYLNRVIQVLKVIFNNKKSVIICSGKFSLWIGGFTKIFFFNQKHIAILHGSEINVGGTIGKKTTSWSLKQFDALIAVSNFTKNLALKNNATLKISVINNGFAFPKIEPDQNAIVIKGNPAVVTVGNVTYRKGQQNVIKALPLLKEKFPEIHYHLIGIPTEKHKFEMLSKSIGVNENCSFHGALTDAEMQQIVSQSKVFFMLSDHLKNGDVEGFGIAVLESNFLGLPAIGSKNSGISDAINDGFSGKLVNPHDENEIVAAFQEIMGNYNQYSSGAIKWSKDFAWEIIVKKYLKIID